MTLPIEDINFTSAKGEKRKLDESIEINRLPVIGSTLTSTQDASNEVPRVE